MKNAKKPRPKAKKPVPAKDTSKRKRRTRLATRASLENLKRIERYLKTLLGYVKVEKRRVARLQKIEKRAKQEKGRKPKTRQRRPALTSFKEARSTADLAYLILKGRKRPVALDHLVTLVLKKYEKKPGKNFRANLKNALVKDQRFKQVEANKFALRRR